MHSPDILARLIATTLPAPFFAATEDGSLIHCNARLQAYAGLPEAAMLGDGFFALLHPDDAQKTKAHWNRAVKARTLFMREFRLKGGDGIYRWFSCRAEREGNGDGVWVGLLTDIEQHKAAQQAHIDSEERFHTVFKTSPVVIAITALEDNRYLEVNDSFEQVTGFSRAETIGRTSAELGLVPDMVRHRFLAELKRDGYIRNGVANIETKSGEQKTVMFSTTLVKLAGKTSILSSWLDISERHRAEVQLRQQREELLTLLDTLPVGVLLAENPECTIITGNRVANAIMRMPTGANLSTRDRQSFRLSRNGSDIPWEERPLVRAARGEIVHEHEMDIVFADGSTAQVTISARPLFTPAGEPRGVVACMQDVSALKHAQIELKNSRDQLQKLMDTIPSYIYQVDAEGRHGFVNRAYAELIGRNDDEIRGLHLRDLFPPDVAQPFMEHNRIVLESGETHEFEEHVRSEDGQRTYSSIKAPVFNDQGKVVSILGVSSDITERIRMNEALQRSEQALRDESHAFEILNSTGASIAAQLNVEEAVEIVTDAATELSGAEFGAFFYTRTDPEGNVFTLYTLSGAEREKFAAFGHPRATPLFGPTFEGKPAIRIADVLQDPRYGQWAPHHGMPKGHLPVRSYLAVPVVSRGGEVIGGLFFGHSQPGVFTERAERIVTGIAAHAAIAIDNARLYEEARREIANRQEAEEALRRTDRLKDEFVATLAHELRNPLAPIRQAANLWNQSKLSDEQLRWSHKVVERQSEHMARLLDDLLDISRITRGQLGLRKEWIDFGNVADAAIETAGPLIRARHHELQVDLQPNLKLLADPVRLTQVLANLLNNAAKFTEPRGRIVLSAQEQQGWLVVRVRDNGIGIDSAMLAQVFEIFVHSTSALNRIEGGLGIGLALVRGLVALHDGEVDASSAGVGMGSEFRLRLPLARPEPGAVDAGPPAVAETAVRARRILIADDNRDMADSLSMYMQLKGHTTRTVYGGEEALSAFADFAPDCVILDIGMPDLNGYETARRIRARATPGSVRLIALTGWGQEHDKKLSQEAGFDHHFTKPLDPAVLAALLG